MVLTAAETAALARDVIQIGIFMRMVDAAGGALALLWMGAGYIEPGIHALDPGGTETYSGLGHLIEVPPVNMLINGGAERAEFTASGVDGDILATFSAESDDIKGSEISLGFGLFTEDWTALVAPVRWARTFYGDYATLVETPTDDLESPVVRTIKVSAASAMSGVRQPPLAYFSHPDQQLRSPGDLFFERVPSYPTDVNKAWPRF